MSIFETFYNTFLMMGCVLGIAVSIERLYFYEPDTPFWIGVILFAVMAYIAIYGTWKHVLSQLNNWKEKEQKK